MTASLRELWHDDSGQAVVEYALVVGLAAIALLVAITTFRTQLVALWTTITGGVESVASQLAD